VKARTVRRVAGGSAAASLALIIGGLPLAYLDRHLVPAQLDNWTISGVSGQVVNMAVPVSGYVLASRRPENRIGWLFLAAGLALSLSALPAQYALHALVAGRGPVLPGRALAWLSNATWVVPVAMLAFLFQLFPTGRPQSRRWRAAAWFAGGAFGLSTAVMITAATAVWAHPFAVETAQEASAGVPAFAFPLVSVLISAALLVSVAALVVRFARSRGEERLQLKWCAAAGAVLVAVFVTTIWVNSAVVNVLQSMGFVGLYTAIAAAVLKYRLYDIDRIISRTLGYAIVTGLLVGVYAGLVLLATQVLRFGSPVAVAAATLAAAALFAPLRRRVQSAVDRRFNRARYDATVTVDAFAARLKDTVDLDTVRCDLAGVVHRALEPAHVSVWVSRPLKAAQAEGLSESAPGGSAGP
jgi:hypothetical protein